MKAMVGDSTEVIPDFAANEEPQETPKPQFAPKTKGLQGSKPEVLAKAAPKAAPVKTVTAEDKEISIESSSLTPLDPAPAPKEVVSDAIAGAFDALPGFENTANSTIIA